MKLPEFSKVKEKLEDKHSLASKVLTRTKIKIVVFNIINVTLIVLLFVILQKLPQDAQKVKDLRSQASATSQESDEGILESELENNKESIAKLDSLFIDDNRFLEFINSITLIEEQGIITDFNIPVSSPIIDASKNYGLPVSLVFTGTVDSVNSSLTQVFSLPFLIRPVNINMDVSPENSLVLRMSGFLYTNESFNKN